MFHAQLWVQCGAPWLAAVHTYRLETSPMLSSGEYTCIYIFVRGCEVFYKLLEMVDVNVLSKKINTFPSNFMKVPSVPQYN